jgi:hypothetical protein
MHYLFALSCLPGSIPHLARIDNRFSISPVYSRFFVIQLASFLRWLTRDCNIPSLRQATSDIPKRYNEIGKYA